jgi:hypothetical protein
MSKYFDWKINNDDKEVKRLLWLREYDNGDIKVVLEYDGIWKMDDAAFEALDRSPNRNAIANSQEVVTNTCFGEAAIKAWKVNGSPSKVPEKTKEYVSNIFMAPLSVTSHLEHSDGRCKESDFFVEMGVEFVDETL